jgi:hypothetical protein
MKTDKAIGAAAINTECARPWRGIHISDGARAA